MRRSIASVLALLACGEAVENPIGLVEPVRVPEGTFLSLIHI